MGLLDKLKDIFSEETDEQPEVKSQMLQVEIGKPKEEDSVIDNEVLKKEEIKESKIYFDDKDFDTLVAPKEKPRTYGFKEETKTVKKEFKASPVISPVYGILDKNYHKDDIKNKQKSENYVERSGEKVTIDDIRKKAFGTLEDDIEQDLFKPEPFIIEENEEILKQDLFDELDFNLDGVLDEKEEEEEIKLDYVINIPKEKELLDELKEDEIKTVLEEEELTKDDLFDLIDQMYDKENE